MPEHGGLRTGGRVRTCKTCVKKKREACILAELEKSKR